MQIRNLVGLRRLYFNIGSIINLFSKLIQQSGYLSIVSICSGPPFQAKQITMYTPCPSYEQLKPYQVNVSLSEVIRVKTQLQMPKQILFKISQ